MRGPRCTCDHLLSEHTLKAFYDAVGGAAIWCKKCLALHPFRDASKYEEVP